MSTKGGINFPNIFMFGFINDIRKSDNKWE